MKTTTTENELDSVVVTSSESHASQEKAVSYEVEISELTKQYGDLVAVDHMNLNVPAGCIFGLLGPNGAGKSTTVRLLCTLLTPTDGTASVNGYDVITSPVNVRKITGVLPEEGNHTLYPAMSVYENLEYFARLYDVEEDEILQRIEELLSFMSLWDRRDDKTGELSTGNRQRLALCRALLHRPKVILLDEPTSSLDPIAAKRVRELILNLARKYKQTFFINSHNLPEVQRMCDRIAIIDQGKIILTGTTSELRAKLHTKQVFRLRVAGNLDRTISMVQSMTFVESVKADVDSLIVTIDNPYENNSTLLRSLLSQDIDVIECAEEETTLEDIYLDVIKGGVQ